MGLICVLTSNNLRKQILHLQAIHNYHEQLNSYDKSHFFLEMMATRVCSRVGCTNAASKACPTCIQLNIPVCFFCSQECLVKEWKNHKKYHEDEVNKKFFFFSATID